MLVKIKQLKKIDVMVKHDIPERMKRITNHAASLGYDVDISASVSKFLDKELTKIEEQLNKEELLHSELPKHE